MVDDTTLEQPFGAITFGRALREDLPMKKMTLAAMFFLSSAVLSASYAQPVATMLVCVGEYETTCKNRFPNEKVEFYGCGDTSANRICQAFCGKNEGPGTCSQTRRAGPDSGNQCGYSWVTVRCFSGN